jgi:carboxylate-amine ligase
VVGVVLTIGVEEEFHLLDRATWQATAAALPVLAAVDSEDIVPELKQSVVETNSRAVTELGELAEDLRRLRSELMSASRDVGVAPLAAGTPPVVDDSASGTFPKERYERMTERYPEESRAQLVCGCQTHVGIEDPELAVEVINRARRFAPVMLALTASSPLWFGHDTGWASFRTRVWGQWPGTGMPGVFSGPEEYGATVQALIDAKMILDPGMVYFDIRRSAHNPTVEFRICDSVPSVDDAVTIAGLWRAIAQTCIDESYVGEPMIQPRIELLRAARLQAARHGVTGDLVDPVAHRLVPAPDAIFRMFETVRQALVTAGDLNIVEDGVRRMLEGGGWAGRIRRHLTGGATAAAVAQHLSEVTIA